MIQYTVIEHTAQKTTLVKLEPNDPDKVIYKCFVIEHDGGRRVTLTPIKKENWCERWNYTDINSQYHCVPQTCHNTRGA